MKTYTVNELRKMFLDYFESKGHLVLKSASLVPHNDNSLLLINSGMAPLKPYFTGQVIPPKKRAASCQKCIRTGDIENIGKTARHGTFFEMLGNFSFGDYFKSESLAWTWEFLTEVVGLDADRLYPSVYLEDDEAFAIWENEIGIKPERIFRFGKADNFWEHGAGPCGPCSEVYYDRGEKYGCGCADCTVGCDCDRYIEIWNNVFTQFDGDGKGNYTELEFKNIDTGMGLERLAAAVQDVESIFDIDTVRALREKVCALANKEYAREDKWDVSIRIVTDHIRSATFMISDGIMPTNEGRGYVLRRIIRRAARHGRLLGIDGIFLARLSDAVINGSKDGYPELYEKKDFIYNVLNQEENKFNNTIDQGLSILSEMEEKMAGDGAAVLSGEQAFKLYDTYGFPIDLTVEIMAEKGYTVDMDGFSNFMQEQKDKARKARKDTNYMGADATVYEELDPALKSEFVGYDLVKCSAEILAITTDSEVTEALTDGQRGTIITDITPFYATGGGQNGDSGCIQLFDDNSIIGDFSVRETVRLTGNKIGHIGNLNLGMLKVGDKVELKVDNSSRNDICKNHSATHLLQKVLRTVLGTHVEQAGSYVDKDRLRFDFSHFTALTADEIALVEQKVNEKIAENIVVSAEEMSLEAARAAGAMALFGEKYGENVRVVRMNDSVELCGGTHVGNTGAITAFKIISETGIAAGVRRIEALTGRSVFEYYQNSEHILNEIAKSLKSAPANVKDKVESLLSEIKQLQSENESLKSKAAKEALGDVSDQIIEINGVKLLAVKVDGVDMNGLRDLGDQQKARLITGVILIISASEGKVNLMAMADESAQAKGAHAGNLIKAIAPYVGGGGGGRPGMAQAGGKNPAGIEAALKEAENVLREQIGD
ncbi:MAG: alanine--tRNA ligase [Lachnospiraceae bacterium]|nr:alanine--tRNA ligase [Lachnospiraceae bacterium]